MLKIRFTRQIVLWSFLALGSAAGFVACDNDDGPMEKIGESVDDAADEIEDAVDKD